jgi:hypothetical protein
MAWDASKDKELEREEYLHSDLVVTLNSYEGGPPKIGVVRIRTTKDGEPYYRKMGRLTRDEATWLGETLIEMSGGL